MTTEARPLSAEEEAELRRDMNLDSEWANPIEGRWPWWCARLLATLDAARDSAGLDEERLYQAMENYLDNENPRAFVGGRVRARLVAAEYARLSEPKP